MTTQENLLRLMCLPLSRYACVVRTTDGYYIAQEHDDIGYNAFLGRPSKLHPGPGLDQTTRTWAGLTDTERLAVKALADNPLDGMPIPLADFGVSNA